MKKHPWVRIKWRQVPSGSKLRLLITLIRTKLHELKHVLLAKIVGVEIVDFDLGHIDARRRKCRKKHCGNREICIYNGYKVHLRVNGYVDINGSREQQWTVSAIDPLETRIKKQRRYLPRKRNG